MMKIYKIDDIKGGIPENMRPFISIESNALPEYQTINLKSFWKACEIISKHIEFNKVVTVIIGNSKFELDFNSGFIQYIQKQKVIHVTLLKSLIYLNFEKMPIDPNKMQYKIRVAIILEELIHAFMNVTDEDLTHKIVVLMYDKIKYIAGKFEIKT